MGIKRHPVNSFWIYQTATEEAGRGSDEQAEISEYRQVWCGIVDGNVVGDQIGDAYRSGNYGRLLDVIRDKFQGYPDGRWMTPMDYKGRRVGQGDRQDR